MVTPSDRSMRWAICAALVVGTLIGQDNKIQLLQSVSAATPAANAIATLANGRYQFCSQPDPKDWRDGAGVCLTFTKVDRRIDGYYGYPHSDNFICVRGKVDGNAIVGEALAISWPGQEWSNPPKSEFRWDSEGHLKLSEGNVIRTSSSEEGRLDLILFRTALLDANGFYRYSSPRMKAASELCDWK